MDLQTITFGKQIKDKNFINYLTRYILINYNIRNSENIFPAPQPVSIEKKDFTKLKQYEYYTSIKLDGIRYIMLFIKDKNEDKKCIIVNRAFNFYIINMNIEDTIYNGTILDGEIIQKDNKYTFFIHDALILCGNKINKKNHSVRLEDTKCCIDSFMIMDENNTLDLKVKQFYPFSEFSSFIENIYNKSTDNDGIIFMPEKLPVISGTQYSMLKWKPKSKHTFDFMIQEVDLGFEAYVFHMGNLKLFANIHKNTEHGLLFIENTKKLDNYENGCIVECTFNKSTNNFCPILVRVDKTHPNSLRTIERTLFNINENIQISDFMEIVEKNEE